MESRTTFYGKAINKMSYNELQNKNRLHITQHKEYSEDPRKFLKREFLRKLKVYLRL